MFFFLCYLKYIQITNSFKWKRKKHRINAGRRERQSDLSDLQDKVVCGFTNWQITGHHWSLLWLYYRSSLVIYNLTKAIKTFGNSLIGLVVNGTDSLLFFFMKACRSLLLKAVYWLICKKKKKSPCSRYHKEKFFNLKYLFQTIIEQTHRHYKCTENLICTKLFRKGQRKKRRYASYINVCNMFTPTVAQLGHTVNPNTTH